MGITADSQMPSYKFKQISISVVGTARSSPASFQGIPRRCIAEAEEEPCAADSKSFGSGREASDCLGLQDRHG